MKKSEFRELLEGVHKKLLDLTETKGEEYSNDDDQLANFKRSAVESGCTKYQVWLIFFNKHMDAIKYFVKNKEIKSTEGLIGRIDDAILYLMLLRAMYIEDSNQVGEKEEVAGERMTATEVNRLWETHGKLDEAGALVILPDTVLSGQPSDE